ncbi:MAG TPA: MFS transporter [Actinomycetota bacterium]|nr:MFS transporter [Actinomycetota bacterium]
MSITFKRTRARLVTPVFLLVMLSTLAYFTAVGMITPTLPLYVEGPLSGSNFGVGVTVGAFAITAVMLRPFVGRLSDKRGRRLLIIGGGVIVAISIAGYALAESLTTLLLARLLTGVGEAGYYVGAASAINDIAPNERRGEALSYFSLALFGGLAIGPVAGETILHATNFTTVWMAAAASAAFAGFVGFLVTETRPEEAGDGPMKLINRGALLPGTVLGTNIWGLATFSSFIPLYVLQLGMDGSRFVFALNSAIIIAIRLFGARLPDKLGPRKSSNLALAGVLIGFLLMAVWEAPIGLYVGTVFYSIGHALLFPALMTMAINQAPVSERGAVVGTFTSFFDLFFGIGAASAGAIASAVGYNGAFAIAAVVAGGGLLLLGYARRSSRSVPAPAGAEAA